MDNAPKENEKSKIDPVAKFLAVLISLTVVTVGVVAIVTQEAPERSTRNGIVGPLFSREAILYGVTMVFFGLLPLAMLAKTARASLIWSVSCASLGLLTLAWGLFFIK